MVDVAGSGLERGSTELGCVAFCYGLLYPYLIPRFHTQTRWNATLCVQKACSGLAEPAQRSADKGSPLPTFFLRLPSTFPVAPLTYPLSLVSASITIGRMLQSNTMASQAQASARAPCGVPALPKPSGGLRMKSRSVRTAAAAAPERETMDLVCIGRQLAFLRFI